MTRVAVSSASGAVGLDRAVDALAADLGAAGLAVVGPGAAPDVALVWVDGPLDPAQLEDLLRHAAAGRPLLLAGPAAVGAEQPTLSEAAGLVVGARTPVHPVRLRPGSEGGEVTARLDGDLEVTDAWLRVDKARDDVEVLLTARMGLAEDPVMTWRPSTNVGVLTCGARPETLADPAYRRLVLRWIRYAAGLRDLPPVRIGMLGFGAIGDEHAAAVAAVDGLELAAVCDTNPARVAAARAAAPGLRAYGDAADLLDDPAVDLVVVSTPPNSHAGWALRALEAGKHVVVEKPFCLTTAEADDVIAAAAAADRLVTVYQNRRWDPDYLALKALVCRGAIGDVFHYESFVGGYGHPCNFWHSDEEFSGGAVYDWGSHYIDWVLDLVPTPVAHVTAASHKRRWHDVTNADHSRVTIRFADGAEAEFVHSDLAAALKPKWYVLGTDGAIVGHWRRERVPADFPASLEVHHPDGSVTSVAAAAAPRQAFHRELADRLLSGVPMSVTASSARRNIAVMEAAVTSAREDGRPVLPL